MKMKLIALLMILPALVVGQSIKKLKSRVLMIVSSYGKDQGKQRPGFEFEEFSQAYLIFRANGLDVDVASPKGGHAEPDAFNHTKPYNKQVVENAEAMNLLNNSKATAQLHAEHYDAVYIVGGKGAMFDLPFDPSLQEIISTIYQKQNGVIAAVCHGPAALMNVKINDTTFLIAGKTMTGFSNVEEDRFGKKWKPELPFLLEDKLKNRAVKYESSEAMLPQVSVDGKLITGQNPFSTNLLAEEILKALGIKPLKREMYKDERSIWLVKRSLSGDTVWAKNEIAHHSALYDTRLIAAYGHLKLMYAEGKPADIRSGLFLGELVSEWVSDKNLQYQMAKGYVQLNKKEKARLLLEEIMKKHPSFEEAKKLADEIK